ncbi:hypothetical protein JTB14_023764 [Gonioctena quinquepunctata]|nr:hypothetical protein JTB14_023764 [Gonioctena quinquepunctata]
MEFNTILRCDFNVEKNNPSPGDGLRSVRTTTLFRAVNFELYTKPNAVIMGIGLVAIAGCAGYIAYMRSKYEGLGYYGASRKMAEKNLLRKNQNGTDEEF